MRTYNDLSRAERLQAIEKALNELVDCIATGAIVLSGNLQAKINFAVEKAHKENMEWSKQEYILEAVRPQLVVLAKGIAEDAKYTSDGDFIKESIV